MCICEGKHSVTEAIFANAVARHNLSGAVRYMGGRAKHGTQHDAVARGTELGLGTGGVWHCHNLTVVEAFVRRCEESGPARMFRGCSGQWGVGS